MNYLQRANLEGFLAWQQKFHRGWVQVDAYNWQERDALARRYAKKVATAREWLTMHPRRVWKQAQVQVLAHGRPTAKVYRLSQNRSRRNG
jgi:hypothetical protein